ncbi:DNA-binding transcriptional regulator, AcrR family [Eubacterium aggregans]|uniref:DNA-binding transcriptional regulator, AcrR family n=1 Tax=Eubacterium aggregans TaxID=81409 RepID=A0A1H3ZLC7_9FIRM|nr:DNA-binding transcriptional regulator, AcrR family [Eubacterium aggregans]
MDLAYSKSEKKRAFILTQARKVFMKKGYSRVTMKDIVTACGISRGGLYLYFSSTKEIFLEVFRQEAVESQEAVMIALDQQEDPRDILVDYIEKHKASILGDTPTLTLATYEFFQENEEEQVIRRWQFDDMAEMLRELLSYGIGTGAFKEIDPAQWGRHLAHFLSGMCLTLPVLKMPEERIDEELTLLLEPVLNS